MKLEFGHLSIRNFMAFSTVEVDLVRGLCFVEGDNRDGDGSSSNFSGKSSLFEAIVWCLYNKTIRKMPAKDIVNNRAKSDPCVVSLELIDQDSKVYKITRTRYAGEYGTKKLSIEFDGVDRTPADKPQDYINALLGLDYESFVNVCVFAHNKQFRFIQMPNAEQKKMIERLVGLGDRFHKYQVVVKEKLSDIDEQYASERDAGIRATERVKGLKDEKETMLSWKKEEAKPIDKGGPSLDTLKKKEGRLKKKADSLSESLDELASEFGVDREARRQLVKQDEALKEEILINEELFESRQCPTCKQKIGKELVKELKAKEKRKSKKIDAAYEILEVEIAAHMEEREKLREEHLSLSEKLFAIKDNIFEKTRKPAEDKTERIKERLEFIKGELEESQRTLFYAKQERVKLEKKSLYFEFLQEAFSRDGIESFLFDRLLPFLNERANYYASELSDGRISISFATLKKKGRKKDEYKDDFHVQVSAPEGGATYSGCSSSEERWADLAVALAKRDLAEASGRVIPNILLIDEAFDCVDDVGAVRALKFLSQYAKDKSVLLISHNPELKEHFDSKITVVRTGGISHV